MHNHFKCVEDKPRCDSHQWEALGSGCHRDAACRRRSAQVALRRDGFQRHNPPILRLRLHLGEGLANKSSPRLHHSTFYPTKPNGDDNATSIAKSSANSWPGRPVAPRWTSMRLGSSPNSRPTSLRTSQADPQRRQLVVEGVHPIAIGQSPALVLVGGAVPLGRLPLVGDLLGGQAHEVSQTLQAPLRSELGGLPLLLLLRPIRASERPQSGSNCGSLGPRCPPTADGAQSLALRLRRISLADPENHPPGCSPRKTPGIHRSRRSPPPPPQTRGRTGAREWWVWWRRRRCTFPEFVSGQCCRAARR